MSRRRVDYGQSLAGADRDVAAAVPTAAAGRSGGSSLGLLLRLVAGLIVAILAAVLGAALGVGLAYHHHAQRGMTAPAATEGRPT